MMRGLLAVALLIAQALTEVRAAPLDAATCGLLKGEQAQLEEAGIRVSMAKGPEWAKANLGADNLQKIRRLIELDEQLLFRCPGQGLVDLSDDADDDGKESPSAKADAAKPKPPGKQEGTRNKDAAPASAKTAPAKPKPKPKPKAKVDDAYRPPPPNPNVDPFANRPARQ